MHEKGSIIQESVSPWSSVFGQKLVLLSFANLKRSLQWKAFQLGADVLDSLAGTSIFLTLGLKNGY